MQIAPRNSCSGVQDEDSDTDIAPLGDGVGVEQLA